jgi:ABC-2 type transport system ATP-binding protein
VLETQSLTKRYGSFLALDNCSLKVSRGEVFGLLGPNGAGKTTLIRLILGYLKPSGGQALVDGLDCFGQSLQVRRRLAYLPAEAKLFRRMRGADVLRFFAAVRDDPEDLTRAIRLAERFDLDTSRRVALMSTGMRQKLALASTLAHDTPLLILDEPTANLDPNVRREVMQVVTEQCASGRTILISSHVLSEVEQACDRVVILRRGKTVYLQDMAKLRQRHRVVGRADVLDFSIPPELQGKVDVAQRDSQVFVETFVDIADVLPWLATLNLRDVMIEPYGLRSVYDRYHSQEVS